MKKGGVLDKQVIDAARTVGLLTPILLFAYSWLIPLGYVSGSHFISIKISITFFVSWVLFGAYCYLFPTQVFHRLVIQLAVHHIFAVFMLLLITGFTPLLTAAWALLCLVSYMYLYANGFITSIGVLFAALIFDTIVRDYTPIELVEAFSGIIVTILVSGAAIAVSTLRQSQTEELIKSKEREIIERERILTIVNNLADAVFSTDSKGVIRVYNASGLNLLDTNVSINGKSLDSVLKLYDADGLAVKPFKLMKESKSVTTNDELRMKTPDEVIRLELTYAPIRTSYSSKNNSGKGEGYIIIARDITRLKSLEEERDEFISVVSHELRTPITVAEGSISNASLMLERNSTDTKKAIVNLDEAHRQVLYLAKMINDLSTLSRAERGVNADVEMINVAQMAHELYQTYAPEAKKKHLLFNLEVASNVGTVNTSRLYLQELLQNLITNAIKYTKEGSITLQLKKEKGEVIFTVKDTGIGISKSDQEKIFGKFYRSEDYRTRETGGTGLGLYVATKLAKRINTSIEIKSRLNHGSTFSFSLPQKLFVKK